MSHTTKYSFTLYLLGRAAFGCSMIQSMHIIYLAEHPEHGKYIGLTSQGLNTRESLHWRQSRDNEYMGFHEALRTSKRKDWSWTILHFTTDGQETAERLERVEIANRNPELNQRAGGAGGGLWTGDTSKFGKYNLGRRPNAATRQKLSVHQSTRPRKRTHSRARMFELSLAGESQASIAKTLQCDPALVSRVLNGKYKP